MLDNMKISLESVRKEDLSIELEIGLVNEMIIELSEYDLNCFEERKLRKELNNLMTHILSIYRKYENIFDTGILTEKLQQKQSELSQIYSQFQESQAVDQQIDQVIQELENQNKELKKIHDIFLRKKTYQEDLQKQIHLYQTIDQDKLLKEIQELENQNNQIKQEKQTFEKRIEELKKENQKEHQTLQQYKKEEQDLQKDIQNSHQQKEYLQKTINIHHQQKQTIEKDIQDLEKEIAELDRIPDQLVQQYNELKETLNVKKSKLSCLLESHKNMMIPKIFQHLKKEQKNQLDQDIVKDGLKALDQKADEVLSEYDKVHLLGLNLKEEYRKSQE